MMVQGCPQRDCTTMYQRGMLPAGRLQSITGLTADLWRLQLFMSESVIPVLPSLSCSLEVSKKKKTFLHLCVQFYVALLLTLAADLSDNHLWVSVGIYSWWESYISGTALSQSITKIVYPQRPILNPTKNAPLNAVSIASNPNPFHLTCLSFRKKLFRKF